MATQTVDVYAFFVNGANPSTNISRVKQDIKNANGAWKGCIHFVLKGIYFSKRNLVVNANTIPSDKVFKNEQINSLIQNARNATGNKIGIYVVYLCGEYLAEGKGKNVIGVGGTEVVYFKNKTDYELFGRILLTDKAEGRYTLAHEIGHVLFKRYSVAWERFVHADPSGPYFNLNTRKRDFAHNNDRKNLMFPISPSFLPHITLEQCLIAKQSKIVRKRNLKSEEKNDFINKNYF